MTHDEFEKRMDQLMGEIEALPPDGRERLRRAAAESRERQAQIEESAKRLQSSLDHLRVNVKYMMFDLEATRRENGYLRKLLEKKQ